MTTASIQTKVDQQPKCWRCGRTLAGYMGRPWSIKCLKCNAINNSPEDVAHQQ